MLDFASLTRMICSKTWLRVLLSRLRIIHYNNINPFLPFRHLFSGLQQSCLLILFSIILECCLLIHSLIRAMPEKFLGAFHVVFQPFLGVSYPLLASIYNTFIIEIHCSTGLNDYLSLFNYKLLLLHPTTHQKKKKSRLCYL